MSSFVLVRRATLFIPDTGPKHDETRGHLHIVLTHVCSEGCHLLVPVGSLKNKSDRTCLLGVGDHKFFTKQSFIDYSKLKKFPASVIIERVNNSDIIYRRLLKETVFARVCVGVNESRLANPLFKKYFAENS